MKKTLLILALLLTAFTFGQTNGITYQAVIYSATGESVPGIKNNNAPLANKEICLQFSIVDDYSQTEYQEKITVSTDEFGMVNLVIGNGTQTGGYANSFQTIVWNAAKKYLKVGLNQKGNCDYFDEISNQVLSYVPFALAANSATSVSGIVGIANGGTNATTITGAKTNLQLQNVDNTSDLNKPLSIATQTALNSKIDKVVGKNLSTEDFTTAEKTKLAEISGVNTGDQDLSSYATTTSTSTALALKVDKVAGKDLSTEDFTTAEKTKLASLGGNQDFSSLATLLSPTFTGTPLAPTPSSTNNSTQLATTAFVNRAIDNRFVDLTSAQNIGGIKTFGSDLVVNGLAIGKGKGQNDFNTAIGSGALNSSIASGSRNTAVGYLALTQYAGSSFDNNTGVGYFNMIGLTTGYGNTSLGAETMFNVGAASNNTAIGNQSLISTTGSNNVGVGARSGNGLTSGSNNTFIGTQARTDNNTGTITNSTAIGNDALVTTSNTIQLGNLGVTSVKTSGKLTTGTITFPNTDGSSGQILSTNGAGIVTWSSPTSVNTSSFVDVTSNQIIAGNKNFTGRIGIGTSSNYASSKLHIDGNGLVVWGGTGTLLDASGNRHGYNENVALTIDGKANNDILQLRDSSAPNTLLVVNKDGKMGIGNTSPTEKLEVTGNIKTSGTITSGAVTYPNIDGTNGQVLSTNGSGMASWTTPATGSTGVDLTTNQTIAGIKNFSSDIIIDGLTIGSGAGSAANTAVGFEALYSNTGGDNNTAIGNSALRSNTGGVRNTATGIDALRSNTSGGENTASGYFSLKSNNGNKNTGTGYESLLSNTTGTRNTGLGVQGLRSNTTGSDNTATGNTALDGNTTGLSNTANGAGALFTNTIGSRNTALGFNTGQGITSGDNNTIIGANVGVSPNTALAAGLSSNIILANGTGAIKAQHNGTDWTLTGGLTAGGITYPKVNGTSGQVLSTNGSGTATWTTLSGGVPYNGATGPVDFGLYDLKVNGITVGRGFGNVQGNTTMGELSLKSNTSGYYNSAFGFNALMRNTTGAVNTAIGGQSLYNNISGNNNTAIGIKTLNDNTTGGGNVAVGLESLYKNISGNDNTVAGNAALHENTTGKLNTAFGTNALYRNITGDNNTVIGSNAMTEGTTNLNNTAVGTEALKNQNASRNTALGYQAGLGIVSGDNNTVIGASTNVTGGSANATAIGYGAVATSSNTIQLGNSAVTDVKTNGSVTAAGYKLASGTASQFLMADGSVSSTSQLSDLQAQITQLQAQIASLNFANGLFPQVTIGTQVWSTKNLDVTTYRDGSIIPQVTDPTEWSNLTTGAWCYVNNDSSNNQTYGKLYNWYAVHDPRGIAPAGYHVATEADFNLLILATGGQSQSGYALKEVGSTHWSSNYNPGATNSSGFTAVGGGLRESSGNFIQFNRLAVFHLSDTIISNGIFYPHYKVIRADDGEVFMDWLGLSPNNGFSVRLVKN